MSTLTVATIKSNSTSPPAIQNSSGTEIGTLCRAWVNFDGSTGSGNTIRNSFNVSSVTRSATGQYSIAFTNAMPDANYAFCGNGINAAGPQASLNETFQPYSFATGSIGFQCTDATNNTYTNALYACVAIFR